MRKRKGFTLMELIIVIIIIAILAAIGLPQFMSAAAKAKMSRAKSNLGKIREVELAIEAVNGAFTDFTVTQTVALAADLDSDSTNDVVLNFYDDIYTYAVASSVATATTAATGCTSPLSINLSTGVTTGW